MLHKVVIIGDITRSESQDLQLVNDLLDALKCIYPSFLFVITSGTERGIGKIIKNRLMPKVERGEPEIKFLDIRYQIIGDGINRADLGYLYTTRNNALVSAGDEFHLFMGRERKGYMQHLLDLVNENNIPHSVYLQGEVTGPKLLR